MTAALTFALVFGILGAFVLGVLVGAALTVGASRREAERKRPDLRVVK